VASFLPSRPAPGSPIRVFVVANGHRMGDAYVRWDVRVERTWFFSGWNMVIYLDVQNLTNRENPSGYRYTQDPAFPDNLRPIEGVGFLPTFGFSVEF